MSFSPFPRVLPLLVLGAFLSAAQARAEPSWDPRTPDSAWTPGPPHPAPSIDPADAPGCSLPTAGRSGATTESCASCHDGTIRGPRHGAAASHPVDIDYALIQARRPADLKSPITLPPEVKLLDGMITCTTCHDGGSKLKFRLSRQTTSRPNTLCLACHDLA